MEVENEEDTLTDEEYVIARARSTAKSNPIATKTWIITAKSLFPNNFGVQFEAYHLEKEAGNAPEAAKCFSELLNKFSQQRELWIEIDKITAALRTETESTEPEMQFLSEMFKHIPLEVQHQLLLMTADHCEDTMEHCRLLLLLLRKFPQSTATHGPRLVDTLLSAEKHSHASNEPVNCYRKLLVCELLPILGDSQIDLSQKLWFRLLHKAIEFYLCSLITPSTALPEADPKANENWVKLFEILDLTGRHLGWDPYLTNINGVWNRENYWQKILSFCQTNKTSCADEHIFTKQLLYCLTILFLNCLYEYKLTLHPEAPPGQIRTSLLLVEAFTDPSLPSPYAESKSKRRKTEIENSPHISIEKPGTNILVSNFIMASNCWDLLRSTDTLQREFLKLSGHLKLEPLLSQFMIDYFLYKGNYDDAASHLHAVTMPTDPFQILIRNIRLICLYFGKKNYSACYEYILLIVSSLPSNNIGYYSNNLSIGGNLRHLIYLPITQKAILQYCCRIIITIIRENLTKQPGTYNEHCIGIIMVLIQLDWPQQGEVFPPLAEQMKQRGSFRLPMFQTYIVNINILEEIMYLKSEHGGNVTFDIFASIHAQMNQRRIATRGADKGVKEDFKQAMRRQVARSTEPIEKLIIQFLTQERILILQALISARI